MGTLHRMAKIHLLQAGQAEPTLVELASPGKGDDVIRVTLATCERNIRLTPLSKGCLHLRDETGNNSLCYVRKLGNAVEVWHKGHLHKFQINDPRGGRAKQADAAGGNELMSPMPGTILKVLVATGEAVTAHQPVIVMESMKMEMTLNAPRDGAVGSIMCQVGQLVDMNALLLRME